VGGVQYAGARACLGADGLKLESEHFTIVGQAAGRPAISV
jgi:hypothetical protein